MGGIGKTTLARVVFHRLKEKFEAFLFVGNVREQLARIRLDELQKKCLQELLKDEDVNIYNLKSTFVKSRLRCKKILLILDDIDNSIAIEDLIKVCDWFGDGSRIIITSRDMQVLNNTSASATYHVLPLDSHQALHLFSLKAFKQNEPLKSYLELSKWVVDYCEGNPLALIVLGCFLHGRGKEVWESAVKKLNQTLHKDIFNVLKLSFDGLDDTQKNVFLDLVFFLNINGGISLEDCTRHIYDSRAHIDISVLIEKSLISVHKKGYIEMHALLMDMGLEMCRQQLISNPEKPIRLCRPEDIDHVFHNDKGIETVRCLLLDLSKIRRTTWRASNFGKMHNLIFLKVHKSDKRRKTSKLAIGEDLDYLSEELRFFIWEEYPFPHVPLHFCSENLITLEMRNSNIRQLWNENQKFPNLKEIILSNSKDLTALPNLSHAPKIKYVGVDGCVNLDQIHSSTALRNFYSLWVGDDGPKRINIGGSMKGTRLGLVMVFNCLDLDKSSFHKVRMKMMICGDVICGVGLRHVEMPMAENEKVKLRYLLPFVRRVKLLEGPIEYGHEFRQHYDYDNDHRHSHYFADDVVITMEVRRRGDRGGERHVEGPLTRQMINDQQTLKEAGEEEKEDEELMIDQREMINDDQVVATTTLMEVEEEELIMEYYCSSSNSNATIFTRVPTCITRWSLLTELTLRKSDMVEDSLILNSLSSLCHAGYCKPLFHQTLSLHIPPSAFTESDDYEFIFERNSGWLYCKLRSYMPLHPDYDFVVEFVHC